MVIVQIVFSFPGIETTVNIVYRKPKVLSQEYQVHILCNTTAFICCIGKVFSKYLASGDHHVMFYYTTKIYGSALAFPDLYLLPQKQAAQPSWRDKRRNKKAAHFKALPEQDHKTGLVSKMRISHK